jgi:hypothetical protein
MSSQHSQPPRGLLNATQSPLYQGRFGRMFPDALPGNYAADDDDDDDASLANLKKLADAMVGEFEPKDGPDGEESAIPALYTYFGQFIDHDITFDPVSLLTKFKDPDGLVDFRTPALDLDNVYGRGPGDQPYLYQDGRFFVLGKKLTDNDDGPRDLPRFNDRALIGDPRNDENMIVSQLQGLFLKFHNRFAKDNPQLKFARVQKRVRFHYQYLVVNDFLPRIVSANVLNSLKGADGRYDTRKFMFYKWRNDPFMPVEFSVAAYRLGHSMIRPGYRLNDRDDSLLPIFPTEDLPNGLTGFQEVTADRLIDWGRFIDIDPRAYGSNDANDPNNKRRLQFAYRIDPSLVGPLSTLPDTIAPDIPRALALRNLERAFRLGLPTGQTVARAFGVTVIPDNKLMIGKATGDPTDKQIPIVEIDPVFTRNCPLWTYILAEAPHHMTQVEVPADGAPGKIGTPQLGPVGGRIVAQVILGLLLGDKTSQLSADPEWAPATGPDFRLRDFVRYALGDGPDLS